MHSVSVQGEAGAGFPCKGHRGIWCERECSQTLLCGYMSLLSSCINKLYTVSAYNMCTYTRLVRGNGKNKEELKIEENNQ